MNYNHELESFYRNYSELILYLLCRDYNNFFSFKKSTKSKLSKHILTYNLSSVIEEICYYLVKNGKYTIYYEIKKEKKDTMINFLQKPILKHEKIDFTFPKFIMSNRKRKKVINSLTLLNSNQIFTDNDDVLERMRFVGDMRNKADIEIGRLGKHFYINDNFYEYYNDYYCLYRKIKQSIEQRKLVDYVLEILNSKLIKIFNLKEDDIIIFNGLTIEKLKDLLCQLEYNTSTMSDIWDKLNNKVKPIN